MVSIVSYSRPSRGLLRDCTTSPINRFAALEQTVHCQQLGPELERSGCSLKYPECGREVGLGQLGGCRDLRAVATKSGTERVVVALLLGALIIIFLTLVAYCNTKYFLQ